MDDFSDLLTKRPQGKSAPMAPQTKAKSSDSPSWVFDDLSRDGCGDDLLFKSKQSAMPVYDKPVYDDEDVFDAIPELTTSQSARFENNFSSISSPSRHKKDPLDDLIGRGGSTGSSASAFDDLIPGFGRSSSPQTKRPTSETSQSQTPPPYRTSSNPMEDPFAVLEENSASTKPTQGFTDPLDEIGKFNTTKTDDHSHGGGVFVDIDPLDSLINGRDKTHLRSEQHASGFQSPVKSSGSYHDKKVSFDEVLEPHNASFDSSDDVWLTVSEIPLFTQPTTAPPPSRPPPPRPTRPMKNKVNEHVRSPARASAPTTPMDELDDFASGRFQTAPNEQPLYGSGGGDDSDLKPSLGMLRKGERKTISRQVETEKALIQWTTMILGKEKIKLDWIAVERATREARERAATEARAKAQRAAVEKASSDARERAERAAV
ncbi:Auxilin-related protein 1 [Raphanus sativus]|nr:Auxilin-related protein 1 [Raphanus sativus]